MKNEKYILIAIALIMVTGCNAKDENKTMKKATSVKEYLVDNEAMTKRSNTCYRIKKKIKKKELPPMTDIEKQDCENAEEARLAIQNKKYKDWSGVMSGKVK